MGTLTTCFLCALFVRCSSNTLAAMDTAKSRPARAGQMAGAMAESAALWKRMVTAKVSRSDGLWCLLALCCRARLLSSSCCKPQVDVRLFQLTSAGWNVLRSRSSSSAARMCCRDVSMPCAWRIVLPASGTHASSRFFLRPLARAHSRHSPSPCANRALTRMQHALACARAHCCHVQQCNLATALRAYAQTTCGRCQKHA